MNDLPDCQNDFSVNVAQSADSIVRQIGKMIGKCSPGLKPQSFAGELDVRAEARTLHARSVLFMLVALPSLLKLEPFMLEPVLHSEAHTLQRVLLMQEWVGSRSFLNQLGGRSPA